MKAPLLALLLVAVPLAGCASQAPLASSDGTPRPAGEPIVAGAPVKVEGPGWAPLEMAKIRPGVMIHTEARDCPSNFVFVRPDNTSVFIGTTAYCVRELHVGSLASVGTNDTIAVLVYSSYEAMAEAKETDPAALEYNDFAVFRVDDYDRRWVNPTMLHYGGPVAMADFASVREGERVRTFANLSDGLPSETHAREAVVAAQTGGWAYLTYGMPVLPGAMGSGVTTADGRAVGVVVNVGVAPHPGANGVARLDKLMAYASEHSKLYMDLVTADLLADLPVSSTPSPQSSSLLPHR